ncbi:hypothetical protein IAE49_10330 [Kosakonia sp. S58]|uniref:hypothetical protein n=1 Tax=unclassified Kosakonia TaxID=2632876 RepID=UPI00190629BA|nr:MULTISPECIES: hypothetical protein [unclassified Kosakonia]MBK0079851.1 hypothetical protein [Kosakonia sp. S57]MBK0086639.1 hypothetical protein [Kosakonia sp. S58]
MKSSEKAAAQLSSVVHQCCKKLNRKEVVTYLFSATKTENLGEGKEKLLNLSGFTVDGIKVLAVLRNQKSSSASPDPQIIGENYGHRSMLNSEDQVRLAEEEVIISALYFAKPIKKAAHGSGKSTFTFYLVVRIHLQL